MQRQKELHVLLTRSQRNPEGVGHNTGQCDILGLKRRKKGRSSYREEAKQVEITAKIEVVCRLIKEQFVAMNGQISEIGKEIEILIR